MVFKDHESILEVLTSQWGGILRSFFLIHGSKWHRYCRSSVISENHSSAIAKILLQKIQDGTRAVPLAFWPSHLRCDNSLVEYILSQVSTSQSSDVAITNCFLYITEYRNFTLSFTLITTLPLERSNLNYSITEMPDNIFFSLWRRAQKQFKIIVSLLLCSTIWVWWLEFNSTTRETEKDR